MERPQMKSNVADLRDFRMTQVIAAADALTAVEPDAGRCIRHLRLVMSTVKKGASRSAMELALAEAEALMIQVNKEYDAKVDTKKNWGGMQVLSDEDIRVIQKKCKPGTIEAAWLFYDKMLDVLLDYSLVRD